MMESLPNKSENQVKSANELVVSATEKQILSTDLDGGQSQNIVFIDTDVIDYQKLIAGIKPGTEVVILDPEQDGVAQISKYLQKNKYSLVHIVSHGSDGSLHLGGTRLNGENLDTYANALQEWRSGLTEDGDILLYGCDVAQDDYGKAFVQNLSQLTGADIAASDDLTGSAQLGGDWTLEFATGLVDAPLAFQLGAMEAYNGVLASAGDVIINEFSQGSDGEKEWVELLVVRDNVNLQNVRLVDTAPADAKNAANWSADFPSPGANPGSPNSGANTTWINSLRGNVAPVLNNAGNPTLPSINEDVPNASNPGMLVADLARNLITDFKNNSLQPGNTQGQGANDNQGIAVTGLTGDGTWQYSLDRGSNWTNFGAVSDTSATVFTTSVTADNDSPVVTLPGAASVVYVENSAPVLIDSAATVTDIDSANFDTGTLTVRLSSGGAADDRLSIRNQGTAATQINLDGIIIKYGATEIGSFTGGIGTESLVVSLNANATPIVVQALLQNITYANASQNPSSTGRTVEVVLKDGDGGASTVVSKSIAVTPQNDASLVGQNLVLYDGTTGKLPGEAGAAPGAPWFAYQNSSLITPLGVTNESATVGGTRLATDNVGYAGYFNYGAEFSLTPTPSVRFTSTTLNPAFPTLDRNLGYTLNFNARLEAGSTTSSPGADVNQNDIDDRAGFNVILLSSDRRGIQLGFFENRIWAYEDGTSQVNPSLEPDNPLSRNNFRTLFTQAEGTTFSTTAATNYSLTVFGDTYTLFANNNTILSGRLRYYSAFEPVPYNVGVFTVTPPDPYEQPNFVFLGDNSVQAGATVNLSQIGITSNKNFENLTIDEDQSTAAIPFTINDFENPTGPFTINPTSTNTTIIPNGNIAIGGTGANRTVTVTPAANQNGTATITLDVNDGSLTTTRSFNVTVNPVNDAPTFTKGLNQTTTAGAGTQTVLNWATGFNPGPVDEAGQLLDSYIVTVIDNPGVFLTAPTIDRVTGNLVYTPVDIINGSTTATVEVRVKDNGGTARNGVDTSAPQSFTITINPEVVSIQATDATANEPGSSVDNTGVYRISRTGTRSDLTVNLAIDASSTASAGDYSLNRGLTVVIPNGSSFVDVTLTTVDDIQAEAAETLQLNLAAGNGYTINPTNNNGIVTIAANDSIEYAVSTSSTTLTEGNNGTQALTFTVTRSGGIGVASTVDYAISGTATNGVDYNNVRITGGGTALTGTFSFAAGEATKTITVDVLGDRLSETDENIALSLSNPNLTNAPENSRITTGTATTTIVNDDGQPIISIDDIPVAEGSTASFTISLSNPSSQVITVSYNTSDGTATTVDNDYTAISSTAITFNPGETTKTITVSTINDSKFEANETVNINLTGATNATVATGDTGVGVLTITNNDTQPTISIDDSATDEGGTATFTVSLSNASSEIITVNYNTTDGTATTADNDYTAIGSTLITFNPGDTTKTFIVNTTVDNKFEANETVNIKLSNPTNSTIADDTGVLTIRNEDPTPTVSISPASISENEGSSGVKPYVFTVSLSNPSDQAITVDYTTNDGTATVANSDYADNDGRLTFNPGVLSQTITVNVNGDGKAEADESFTVALNSPNNAAIGSSRTATGTIVNDDFPSIGINYITGFNTREEGRGTAIFGVKLISQPTADVFIGLTSDNILEGTLSTNSLTFTPTNWNVEQIVTVTGVDDDFDDGDVAYKIIIDPAVSTDNDYNNLKAPDINYTNIDNDTAGFSIVPISNATTTEAGGTTSFRVKLNSRPTADVSVNLASDNPGEGVVTSGNSLSFNSTNWNVEQTVTLTGVDDEIDDGNIVYKLIASSLSSDANYSNKRGETNVTNINNDTAGFTITPILGGTTGLTTTEAGGTASFSVKLNSKPTDSVTLNLASDNSREGVVSTGSSLTFDSTNWNREQIVTITGVDDTLVDGDIGYKVLTSAATSRDLRYNGLNPEDVSVTNTNDDVITIEFNIINGTDLSEILGGTAGNDRIFGFGGNDTILAGFGIDEIFGGDGNDRLFGGDGDDRLFGETGNDQMWGDGGEDFLYGGAGNDVYTGGFGRDTFVVTRNEGVDRITDFKVGEDTIACGGGLRFDSLLITQNGSNTLLIDNGSNQTLAILIGVNASNLTSSSFRTI